MQLNSAFYRKLALVSYLGLLMWVPVWHIMLAEPLGRSFEFEIFLGVMWTVPLLLPLKGILKAQPYTHAWANFIVMFYIIHGLTSVYAVENETLYAMIELILSTGMFVGCSVFARMRGKELGQGLPKLKEVMAEEKRRFER